MTVTEPQPLSNGAPDGVPPKVEEATPTSVNPAPTPKETGTPVAPSPQLAEAKETQHTETAPGAPKGHPQATDPNAGALVPQEPKTEGKPESTAAPVLETSASETALAKVQHDKMHSRARAWEESAKAKLANRAAREEAKITAWETNMKNNAEARLHKAEQYLEKQRAKYTETMKNEVALAHRTAEEKRAVVEAKRGEEFVKVDELAAKYRATGKLARKYLCFTP